MVAKIFKSGMKRKSTIILIILFSIGLLLVICSHLAGYKIYGSPTLYENQPLDKPRKVADINELGEVILADGNRYRIYGIKTILPDPLGIKYFQWQLSSLEVEVVTPEKPVSKMWWKTRLMYWCGNIWFPRFFPRRLPKFGKVDLGVMLVRRGAAVPAIEVFQEDLIYAKQLIDAMERTAPELEFQRSKDHAYELGTYLINEHSESFNTGAWLLAHAADSDISGIVKKRIIDTIKARELEGHNTISPNKVVDLVSILIKVSPRDAKEVVHEIVGGYRRKFPYLKVALVLKLLTIDDWHGLDTLMDEIVDTSLERSYRQSIVGRLENPLAQCWKRGGDLYYTSNWEDYYAGLAQWYRDNKDRLIWNDERQEMTFRKDDKSSQ